MNMECGGKAMKEWKMAMKHWKEQQMGNKIFLLINYLKYLFPKNI